MNLYKRKILLVANVLVVSVLLITVAFTFFLNSSDEKNVISKESSVSRSFGNQPGESSANPTGEYNGFNMDSTIPSTKESTTNKNNQTILSGQPNASTSRRAVDSSNTMDGFFDVNSDSSGMINVVKSGADNTGKTDNTELLTQLHNTGKRIYYPNGTYRFNGKTLNFSGGITFESRDQVIIRNNISDTNIVRFDNFGNFIGLMQNHLESKSFNDRSGSLVSPPLSTKKYDTKVDLLAYWYNDFGLKCQSGWKGWQTWEWNHHDVKTNPVLASEGLTYNPSCHPLLGYYYGDDPVALDWQCYWLYEYGVKNVAVISTTLDNWEKETSRDHWVYQLFHKAPNFKNLHYTAFVETPDGVSEQYIRNAWKNTLEKLYFSHDNYYKFKINGDVYPVINLFDERALTRVFGTSEKTKNFYIEIAREFKNKGFPGVVMMTRNPTSFTSKQNGDMEDGDVFRYDCTYVANYVPGDYLGGKYSYTDIVNRFEPKSGNQIIGIATSMETRSPHPSKWKCYGTSASEFNRWLGKAVSFLKNTPKAPQLMTLYNVSEWGEGGVGLLPTVGDGFSYLEAVKNTIIK